MNEWQQEEINNIFDQNFRYTLHLEPTACNIVIPSIVREAGIVSLVINYIIIIIIIIIITIIIIIWLIFMLCRFNSWTLHCLN